MPAITDPSTAADVPKMLKIIKALIVPIKFMILSSPSSRLDHVLIILLRWVFRPIGFTRLGIKINRVNIFGHLTRVNHHINQAVIFAVNGHPADDKLAVPTADIRALFSNKCEHMIGAGR
jgi:hypothetical protein